MFRVCRLWDFMHLAYYDNKIWWWNHDESMANENRPYHVYTHIWTRETNVPGLQLVGGCCRVYHSIEKVSHSYVILCSVESLGNHHISGCGKIHHATNQFQLISKMFWSFQNNILKEISTGQYQCLKDNDFIIITMVEYSTY